MNSIFETSTNELHWSPTGLHLTLRDGDGLFAEIRPVPGRTQIYAETADGGWMLTGDETAGRCISIYQAPTDAKLGLFLKRHGPQRRLLLLDGTLFTFKPAYERGRNVWKFLDAQDQCLYFLSIEDDLQLRAKMELLPFARNVAFLPLLLVLGGHQMWMEREDAKRRHAKSPS